uniref:Uncharacterized protein n=1 Tax=Rangifer tarandus platyrhynchus TaxID=3082113 RepID=A0ACB0DPR3_RANTA|nr:unnamed protein product [Rangifer tarandus platyrhynchus]
MPSAPPALCKRREGAAPDRRAQPGGPGGSRRPDRTLFLSVVPRLCRAQVLAPIDPSAQQTPTKGYEAALQHRRHKQPAIFGRPRCCPSCSGLCPGQCGWPPALRFALAGSGQCR